MTRNNRKLLLFLLIRTESCDHGFMQAFARGYINSNFTVKEEEKKSIFQKNFCYFHKYYPTKTMLMLLAQCKYVKSESCITPANSRISDQIFVIQMLSSFCRQFVS